MQCSTKGLCLPAAVLVAGCLAAGCGSTAQSAISNLPSKIDGTGMDGARPGRGSLPTRSRILEHHLDRVLAQFLDTAQAV